MHLLIEKHLTLPAIPHEWTLQVDYHQASGILALLTLQNEQGTVLSISQTEQFIKAEILFDAKQTPIILLAELPETEAVSLLISNSRSRIALYVNQQLCDEDWTLGSVPLENCICTESDAQIVLGDDFSAENCDLLNSSFSPVTHIQNWSPDGLNTGVGDVMPFSHDGTFHLFYLFDRRGHGSKWGLGAHQWAHLSTTDLLTWQQHPMAIGIDEQYEGSICTGSLIFHNGLYYAYYAVRMSDGSPAKLSWAVSSDGIHFQKTQAFFTLSAPYEPVSARDPFVFRDDEGLFHLLITTSLIDPHSTPKGCLAHLTSVDLQSWQQQTPFLVVAHTDQPECSDYFHLNGWYTLIFSNYGRAHYRISRTPFGPWLKPENDILGFKECRVPKTAIFKGNRIIIAGFVVFPNAGYAGELIVYEALQNAEGTLSFFTPKELDTPRTVLT
ncbi:MAG: hypothetical protein ABI700_07805 [Chloroflexota bacterium]